MARACSARVAATIVAAYGGESLWRRPTRAKAEGAPFLERDGASGVQILCRDLAEVSRKRQVLVDEGASHLQIIADFDYTLSAFTVNGRPGTSSHGVIESCDMIGDDYARGANALKEFYYPKEVDHSLSHEERVKYMVEWVTQAHDLMVATRRLTKDMIKDAATKANVALRRGHGDFFQLIEKRQIPLLIFSAGIADVLHEIIRQHSARPLPETAHVISNRMEFDEKGVLTGFKGEMFHVFNKNAAAVQDEPFFSSPEIQQRGNILLLGDSLGDPGMVTGIPARTILSVGFLNDKVQERLPQYLAAYDVVIVGDAGLDYAIDILRELRYQ